MLIMRLIMRMCPIMRLCSRLYLRVHFTMYVGVPITQGRRVELNEFIP